MTIVNKKLTSVRVHVKIVNDELTIARVMVIITKVMKKIVKFCTEKINSRTYNSNFYQHDMRM